MSFVNQSRKDLSMPALKWYVSQQPPTDDDRVNSIDVTAELETVVTSDKHLILIQAFDLPEQDKKLVIDTRGIVWLGEKIANQYLDAR